MINSIYEASALVTEKIREHGEQIKSIRSANNNRHSIVESSTGKIYWVLFKRGFFMSFGKIFGKDGPGESVNEEVLNDAISYNVDNFLFVYEDGKIYHISPKDVKEYCEANHTTRQTDSGEWTYSFPVKNLVRW